MKTVIVLVIALFICGSVFSEEAQIPEPTEQEWAIYQYYKAGFDDDYKNLSSFQMQAAMDDMVEKSAEKYGMTSDEVGEIVSRCGMLMLIKEYEESLKENP